MAQGLTFTRFLRRGIARRGASGALVAAASVAMVGALVPAAQASATTASTSTAAAGAKTPAHKNGAFRIIVEAGNGQASQVNSAFHEGLVVKVVDSSGKAVKGNKVIFRAPTDGASAGLGATRGRSGGHSTAEYTNQQGLATVPGVTADRFAGAYQVKAYASGVSKPATFSLTNLNTTHGNHHAAATNTSPQAPTATTGDITGTVTNGAATALSGVCVQAFESGGGPGGGATNTDASGNYDISNLTPATDYVVQFDAADCSAGNYLTQYYNGQPTQATATLVPVTANNTTGGINATMQPGGEISGTVTNNSAPPAPLANVCVNIWQGTSTTVGSGVVTAANGTYTVEGLPAGQYQVQFDATDCGGGNYFTQWYNNQPSQNTANSVSVTVGSNTSGVNAAMVPSGTITGTVTAASGGSPIQSVCVDVFDALGSPAGFTSTDSTGAYTVGGLATGSYTVEFDAGSCGAGNYITQWYNDQPSQGSANPVSVTAPATTSNVNAALVVGGMISGTVTSNATPPVALQNVCANIFDSTGTTLLYTFQTGTNGTYFAEGLPTGNYTVQFDAVDCSGANYLSQWYNNQPSAASANVIPVTAGQTASSINAALQAGGQITGKVTNSSSTALAGVCVQAYIPNGTSGGNAQTDANGNYTVQGLPSGTYVVTFDAWDCGAGNYLTVWYNNATTQASATPVPVTAGQTTSGINEALQPGGEITGTVTDTASPTPNPLSGVCVTAVIGNNFVQGTTTAANGAYAMGGLAAGNYDVSFDAADCSGGNFVSQWYNNQPTQASANAVTVTQGSTNSGINAAMQPGASINGTVTDNATPTANPLASVCANVYDNGGNQVYTALTDVNGHYSAIGLTAGTYTVEFDAYDCGGGNYAAQWYNNQPTQGAATPVTLTAGQSDTGVNAAMAPLTYVPLTPFRVLDTRNGTGAPAAQLGPNQTIAVQITGVDGIPDTATAVAINLTAVNANASGTHLTVWPDGNPIPTASNLNVHSPASVANFDIVGIGSGTGKIDINNLAGNIDVIADIAGYYVSSNYTPVVPYRVLDTRNGTGAPAAQLGPNQTIAVQITGADSGLIPNTAKAVAINLTAVNASATGTHLTVWPDGASMPTASNLNIHSPASIANFDVVGIGSGTGKIDINNLAGNIDVIADIAGYYTGTAFVPITPFRALDTRNGTGTGGTASPLGPNGDLTLQLRGVGGIPSNATAVAMNVTAVNATAAGTHLIVWPAGFPEPTASNLNIHSPASIANFDIAALGPFGAVNISNLNGNVDVIADVEGYQIG